MKTFEFENNLRKEFGNVNVIYNDGTDLFTHVVLEKRKIKSNLSLGHWNYFNSINEVKESKLFKQHQSYTIIVVTQKGTDCNNWIVKQI